MKKWIATKLFDLALRVDFEATGINACILVFAADIVRQIEQEANKPKPKRGRPFGSKNKPKTCGGTQS